MADEATLTIRFKDESSPSGGRGTGTPGPATGFEVPGSALAGDFHRSAGSAAQTARSNNQASPGSAAGPVAASIPSAHASPVPPAGSAAPPGRGDPLFAAVQQMVQADPSVTAADLQQALGIQAKRAQQLFAATTAPPAQPAPAANVPSAGTQPVPPAGGTSVLPTPPAPTVPTPATPTPATPPATPPVPPPPTVNQFVAQAAGLAGQFGPAGRAVGGAARTALAAIPSAGAMAIPASAMAAIGVAGAAAVAIGVPIAAAAIVQNEANRAASQIGGLSGDVASANAEARVRQLMANLRTADRLGDEVADNIEANSRLSAAGQGLRDIATEPFLRELNKVKGLLATLSESILKLANKNPAATSFLQDASVNGAYSAFGSAGITAKITLDVLHEINRKLGRQNSAASDPISKFMAEPHLPLPPPFTDTGNRPLNADFIPVPGLHL